MSTSYSFETPMTSFSAINPTIINNADDDSQYSFHSLAATMPKRQPTISSVNVAQARATDNRNIQHNDDEEEDHSLTEHYESNRKKQQKLLLFSNIFRLLVICVLAPLLYFIV